MGLGLIFGGDVTKQWDASATAASGDAAPLQLGEVAITRAADGLGYRYWEFVENPSGGATLPAGTAATWVAAGGGSVIAATGVVHSRSNVAGIVQASVAVDKRFWIQTWGRGIFLAEGAAIISGDQLITSNGTAGSLEEAVLTTTDYATVAIARATVADAATGACDIVIRK